MHFVLYEYLKNTIHFRKQGMSEESSKKLSNLEYLSTAAIAKFAASVSTYPHEVTGYMLLAKDADLAARRLSEPA